MQGAQVWSLAWELDLTCIPQLRSLPAATKTQYNQKKKNHNNNRKTDMPDFPGGTVDKNLPAIAGGMGSIPGPGRSHMQRSN